MNNKSILTAALCGFLLFTTDSTSLFAQHKSAGHHQPVKKPKGKAAFTGTHGQFPESSDRMLTEKDVEHQTAWGMKVMMNEVYARHGYVFSDAALKKHFRKEKWYKGKERNMKKIKLTDVEEQNIAFIRQRQSKAKN